MRERIDILVPESVLAQNSEKRTRLAQTHLIAPTDRAPVVVDIPLFAALEGRGAKFSEMTLSPRDHLRGLILNHKYRCEHVRDDLPIEDERLILELDLGAIRGVEFPMEVVFHGDNPPKTIHLLKSAEQIDHLTIPDPYSGHNRMRIDWTRAMSSMVDDFEVRLNGERLPVEVTLNHSGGPIPSAFALCGANLFLWIATDPERVHKLMDIVTQSHLNCIDYLSSLDQITQPASICLGADTAEMISGAHFKIFVKPYYLKIWEKHSSPRNFHMCGKIDHLLQSLHDDLNIAYLDGFGFPTDRDLLAEHLAGKVALRGGPHPVLVHDGPRSAIIDAASKYLRSVGRGGGYILSEGFGIMPGTPPEHIDALVEASRRVGWAGSAGL